MTQRPQHLLSRAATRGRVFFFEEPIWHAAGEADTGSGAIGGARLEILQETANLWIIRPHLTHGQDADEAQKALLAECMASFEIAQYVCWYYTPMARGFTAHLAPRATVYDCMDELANFAGAPPALVAREQGLFAVADVVFTGGISLYEAKQQQHGNVHAFPSSIDVRHFAQAQGQPGTAGPVPEPADQAAIPHPRAGFYGVIDERFDTGLLQSLAVLRPQVHFVVLGPVVKIDAATLPRAANIHYLGAKTYNELPGYIAGWDAALLLFALNDATRFISPTKTPEYLAAGKAVVSTPIRDVIRGYGDEDLVAIAGTPEEFASALDKALGPQTEAWRAAVATKLAASSWDTTWAAMRSEIQKVCLSQSLGSLANDQAGADGTREAAYREEVLMGTIPVERLSAAHTMTTGRVAMNSGRAVTLPRTGGKRLQRRTEHFDYIVVGAGFAGSVLAERLASQEGKRVFVIDKRDHIAGNAYDFYNAEGILVHLYGPHIFHTNAEKVVSYLSQFTEWRPYQHRVLSSVDGQLLPVPINLDTINRLYNLDLDADGMQRFLEQRRVVPATIRTSEEIVVSRVGRELYEKFFRNYTRKQWGLDPSELDASVAGRIPVRFDRDDRYFTDSFQAMPLEGYTRMFERMLDHSNIVVRTGVSYQEARRSYPDAKIIYTGAIDEYFDFRYGALPYRSLEFRHETHDKETYQAAPVINYPNEHAYTRVTEFKYLTGQQHRKTSIVYEFPQSDGDPYYPIPRPENAALYAKYKELADRDDQVYFCGRLANYRYLNMDQVVAQALTTFRQIADGEGDSFPAAGVDLKSAAAVQTQRIS